jgi:hypothetical protein
MYGKPTYYYEKGFFEGVDKIDEFRIVAGRIDSANLF